MEFLIEIFWAVLMAGLPIAAFTLAIVWWALEQGHFRESLDIKALESEIKAMSKKKKKNKTGENPKLHPVQKQWTRFGGGFYGIVAFFTYLVVEVLEIISLVVNFGGFFEFLKQLDLDIIIGIFIDALMNFITAMIWPVYWMKRIDTDQTWIWFVIAYLGYWAGLRLARALKQKRTGASI